MIFSFEKFNFYPENSKYIFRAEFWYFRIFYRNALQKEIYLYLGGRKGCEGEDKKWGKNGKRVGMRQKEWDATVDDRAMILYFENN